MNASNIITTIMTATTESHLHLGNSNNSYSENTTDIMMEIANTTIPPSDKPISDILDYTMSAIVGPIVCFFGIAGNILSIITWCRPGMTSSTGRYLTGQAIADIFVLLMFLLCDSTVAWDPEVKFSTSYAVFFCYIGYPLFFLSVVCSIWITVGVTIDRYIMVCWITKSKRFCSERRANFGLMLITVNAFFINLPHFASYTLTHPHDESNSSAPKPAFVLTEFGSGSGGKMYEFWIHCIILILIPWVSVLTFNIMIINTITKSNKKMENKKTRESMRKSKESETQITRLLLTVTFSFLFFIGLQCIIQCFWMQRPVWANMDMVNSSFAFGKTGIVFNSSLNFVLYCLSGKRFRVELMKVFGFVRKDSKSYSFSKQSISGTGSSGQSSSQTTSTTGSTNN